MPQEQNALQLTQMDLNADTSKPGRSLTVFDHGEIRGRLGKKIDNNYLVRIDPGMHAGNHWHKYKRELFVPIAGRLRVVYCRKDTPEDVQKIVLDGDPESDNHFGIIIPTQVAHTVQNIGDEPAILDVYATHKPRQPDDDFELILISD